MISASAGTCSWTGLHAAVGVAYAALARSRSPTSLNRKKSLSGGEVMQICPSLSRGLNYHQQKPSAEERCLKGLQM